MQMGNGAHGISLEELQAYKNAYDALMEGSLEDPFCPLTVLDQAAATPGRVAVNIDAQ